MVTWLKPLSHWAIISTENVSAYLMLVIKVILANNFLMIRNSLLILFQSTLGWYFNGIKPLEHFFMDHVLIFGCNWLNVITLVLSTETSYCNCLLVRLISRISSMIAFCHLIWSLQTVQMLFSFPLFVPLH